MPGDGLACARALFEIEEGKVLWATGVSVKELIVSEPVREGDEVVIDIHVTPAFSVDSIDTTIRITEEKDAR